MKFTQSILIAIITLSILPSITSDNYKVNPSDSIVEINFKFDMEKLSEYTDKKSKLSAEYTDKVSELSAEYTDKLSAEYTVKQSELSAEYTDKVSELSAEYKDKMSELSAEYTYQYDKLALSKNNENDLYVMKGSDIQILHMSKELISEIKAILEDKAKFNFEKMELAYLPVYKNCFDIPKVVDNRENIDYYPNGPTNLINIPIKFVLSGAKYGIKYSPGKVKSIEFSRNIVEFFYFNGKFIVETGIWFVPRVELDFFLGFIKKKELKPYNSQDLKDLRNNFASGLNCPNRVSGIPDHIEPVKRAKLKLIVDKLNSINGMKDFICGYMQDNSELKKEKP
jgi:hypothetical protein